MVTEARGVLYTSGIVLRLTLRYVPALRPTLLDRPTNTLFNYTAYGIRHISSTS